MVVVVIVDGVVVTVVVMLASAAHEGAFMETIGDGFGVDAGATVHSQINNFALLGHPSRERWI